MILAALLLGAAVVAGTALIAAFWNDLVAWLKRCIRKVSEIIRIAVYGTMVFLQKIAEGIEEISKHYSKMENGRWRETVVTKVISPNEVPPEILARAKYHQQTDITSQLELQLAH